MTNIAARAWFMNLFSRKSFLFSCIFVLQMISSCSAQKLRNSMDSMAYQCGEGYNPDRSYIKISDPTQKGDRSGLVVLTDGDIPVTEKGCIERPQKRVFVTNSTRSAGIWVAPDSGSNLTLESMGRLDLPAACNSLIHADGNGFTLKFDLNGQSSLQELQSLHVRLHHFKSGDEIYDWEPRPLNPVNYFEFRKEKPILSGEYRLVANITDTVRNVQSRSECTLRLDDSRLDISPANRILEKRNYNGQEVLIVQPGYSVNFYVHEGFRDVSIEYCLVPLTLEAISPVMDSRSFECKNPLDFLNNRSESLMKGFWVLNYRGRRGVVETAWQHAILLVETTCAGVFESVAALRGLGCTVIRGSLTLNDLNEDNQKEMDQIGRITGDLRLGKAQIEHLNAFPNLHEIIGELDLTSDYLQKIEGFNSLKFVLDSVTIKGTNLLAVSAFENLQLISGNFDIIKLEKPVDIQPFKQLQSIEGMLRLVQVNVPNMDFMRNLRYAAKISLEDMNSLIDLSGFDSIEHIGMLKLFSCLNLNKLAGMPKLKTVSTLSLEGLPLANLSGFNTVDEVDHLEIMYAEKLKRMDRESRRPLKVSVSLSVSVHTALTDLTDLDFNPKLKYIAIYGADIPSLRGLEKVETLDTLILEDLDFLKSLDGLQNLRSVSDFKLEDTSVSDISALKSWVQAKGNVTIDRNPSLAELRGLENLKTVEGDLRIKETGIKSLAGLPKGGIVHGRFILQENSKLISLEGLNQLNSVGSDLQVWEHYSLQSLKGMEGLTVNGNAFIGYSDFRTEHGLPALEDIAPLTQVTRIGGALRLNSPICVPPEFITRLQPKVFGEASENFDPLPTGELAVFIKQPESC